MDGHFFLGAYWAARRESIEQCADRLLKFFAGLTKCDEVFSTWYEKGWTVKQTRENIADVGNREYLLKRLDRGRNRRDTERTVIEELGFSIDLWNGRDQRKVVGLRISCGGYSTWVGNCVTLDLPEDLGNLNQTEHMLSVLSAVARAWEPEWAGVMSRSAMDARNFNAKVPFVDWMVFIPQEINRVPQPSSVVKLQGIGSIIVVQPNPPSNQIPEEVERVRKIEEILTQR